MRPAVLAVARLAPRPPAAPPPAAEARPAGERVLRFEALDIEGEVGKPRLLYFLNRVKAELGTGRAPRRSFLPELRAGEADRGR